MEAFLNSVPESEALLSFGKEVLALAGLAKDLLYARVDVVLAGDDLDPVLMELELIEPALFNRGSKETSRKFARAVKMILDTQ